MNIGYARVSTGDQNLDLQLDALKAAGCEAERIFTDRVSGGKTSGLAEALRYVRGGDTLVVWRLDRLGRSLSHLIQTTTGLEDLLFLTGMESDPKLPDVLDRCTPAQGIRTVASLNRYVGDMSDHHVFRLNRRPYLFLTCGRWAHYHRASDTPEKLNYQKMAAITEYLTELSVAVAETPLDGPFEGYDSTKAELHFMRHAIEPFARMLGFELASRRDIERVVTHFMGHFRL